MHCYFDIKDMVHYVRTEANKLWDGLPCEKMSYFYHDILIQMINLETPN